MSSVAMNSCHCCTKFDRCWPISLFLNWLSNMSTGQEEWRLSTHKHITRCNFLFAHLHVLSQTPLKDYVTLSNHDTSHHISIRSYQIKSNHIISYHMTWSYNLIISYWNLTLWWHVIPCHFMPNTSAEIPAGIHILRWALAWNRNKKYIENI